MPIVVCVHSVSEGCLTLTLNESLILTPSRSQSQTQPCCSHGMNSFYLIHHQFPIHVVRFIRHGKRRNMYVLCIDYHYVWTIVF